MRVLVMLLLLGGNAAQAQLPAGSAAAQAAALSAQRFVPNGETTVRDQQTGLLWTQRENGYAVDWYQAREYCAKLDGGWRLPNAVDLAAIQDDVRSAAQPCANATCKSETPFRLVNGWLWSDTSNGISEAIGVNLLTGEQQSTYRAKRHRALCVSGS